MKTIQRAILLILTAFTLPALAQRTISSDKFDYRIDGEYYFKIVKIDKSNGKELFKAETKIPNKKEGEMYFVGPNSSYFNLVGEKIIIVYDIWKKSNSSKDCFVKTMDVNSGEFSNPILLYTTKINSKFSTHEIVYSPFYSPDMSKLAVFKDNISPTYQIEPELTIYNTVDFKAISTKKISSKYQGQKRVFDQRSFNMNNSGDITLSFSQMNEQTRMTTKSFTGEIPFSSEEISNIRDKAESNGSNISGDQISHGRFYKNLSDFSNDKPIPGVRIKNGSFSWSVIKGTDFKIIDEAGNITREDTKDLPSDLFTYKSDNFTSPYLIRIVDKKPYIVLVAGKLNYYSLYQEQQVRYYSEGWDGELKRYKDDVLEDYFKKYNLYEEYKQDKPKREFKDDVNGYFNKIVAWEIKYFRKLNEVMK